MCNERSGFLFSHNCDRFDTSRCIHCEKPICEEHTTPTVEGAVCTSCAKNDVGHVEEETDNSYPGGRRQRHSHDHYDPYFYGGYYYSDYGRYHGRRWGHQHHNSLHDDNDFTEADSESLSHQDNEDFESDLGES